MGKPSDQAELISAWRALAGTSAGTDGWRSIPVACRGPLHVLAARHFPGDEEALLVGFGTVVLPPSDQLPRGTGFRVAHVTPTAHSRNAWLGLTRERAGNLELFTMMAVDVLGELRALASADEAVLLRRLLARVRAWQEFMRRTGDGVLNGSAEIGLFGELVVLQSLLQQSVAPDLAIDAWEGPLDGLQDFRLGTGAVEVKTTIAPVGFAANVASLEQLDEQTVNPLFIAGVRLGLSPNGHTLPEMADMVRELIPGAALVRFNISLIHAGLVDAASERYVRRFMISDTRYWHVGPSFPRLTRASVPPEIRSARYELDLDLLRCDTLQLSELIDQAGAL